MTEYWKNRLNNLDFLAVQNVRQYYFHDVAKYEKLSQRESINILRIHMNVMPRSTGDTNSGTEN